MAGVTGRRSLESGCLSPHLFTSPPPSRERECRPRRAPGDSFSFRSRSPYTPSVIESLEISNLRGIRTGKLEGLTPLTVLVGPNSSGKSTVLDALLIAASLSPGDAVGRAVRRRTERDADARWLLWRQGEDGAATLKVRTPQGDGRDCTLSVQAEIPIDLKSSLLRQDAREPFTCIETHCSRDSSTASALTLFSADNLYEFTPDPARLPEPLRIEPYISLLDMRGLGTGTPLPNLYTTTVTQGRREDVLELLREIIPGLRSLEILVTPRNTPVLHLVFQNGSVPVALAGDGIRTMLRLSLELVTRPQGLVLIEEPEVHQHPRALHQSAKVLLASMRRGLQIVLSTHSLELIDALLLESTQEDLQRLSVYRLKLNEGALASSRLSGDQLAFARGQIEEDLR